MMKTIRSCISTRWQRTAQLAVLLACIGSGAAAVANGNQDVEPVDLFPAQSWDSLTQSDMPDTAAADEMELPELTDALIATDMPLPFSAVAEWKEGKQRIVVLDGMGKTFVLCRSCKVPGAVHPGEVIEQQYKLKALNDDDAIFIGPAGKELTLTLTGLGL
ncbi:hypothetical protein [Paraherbaspirillum soli]|uniref:Uncharacterized protein n=1 Tax=Paraherbaspirillum soli TaxID=631222 RepID=A0ABW0MDN7_9BURK